MALPISAASDRSREIYRIPQMCGLCGFRRATACRRALPRWPPCCLSLTFYIWRCICVECLGERMPIEKSDLLQGTLDVLILKIVALEPLHGYGIAQRIRQISKSVLQVQQGSLYPALHRLEKRGWLHAKWGDAETGREAKFYSLTRLGRKQLEAEMANWDRLSEAVTLILRTVE